MVNLSVNINKLAPLRNARGGNNPDIIKAALDIERYGAHGITVYHDLRMKYYIKNNL